MRAVPPARRWRGLALLGLLLIPLPGCGAGSEPDPAEYLSGTVQIGVNEDLPGWSLYSNGIWSGFDIKLGNWLGEELGFRPQYTPLTTNERIIKLQETGEAERTGGIGPGIKLVIANFSITDERRKLIDFAGPYFVDSQGILTTPGSGIEKVEDIERKVICTTGGSTPEKRLYDMQIQPALENTLGTCVERLLAGRVQAVSSDRVLLEGFAARHRGKLQLASGIRVGSERYGIGLPNDRPELCAFLTRKIAKFINEEWDQKIKDTLPGISPEDRKPNSDALDPCEKPTQTSDQALVSLAVRTAHPAVESRCGRNPLARSSTRPRRRGSRPRRR